LAYREGSAVRVGSEEPYGTAQALLKLPPTVPPDKRAAILALQADIRRVNGLPPLT